MTFLDTVLQSFSIYYGLDWLCFLTGFYGSYLLSNRNRQGFIFSLLSCAFGFSTALISGQFGFVFYNLILVVVMVRGFINWRSFAFNPAE